jgi:predicted DNA-binding protein with PD1-like motif
MVFGNATLGRSIEGKPLVHCHAVVRTESGEVMGGHILTERAVVGSKPISVLVTSLEGFELRQAYDEETRIPLLQPVEADKHE